MPRVPVRLNSSRSCICMRRTTRAHPGSRGRNRPQPSPSLPVATRTGGGSCWWCSTKKTLSSRGGGGGGRDCSTLLMCFPMRSAHNPATGGNYMSAYSRCSARCCTAGLVNTVGGNMNEPARCRSRNTPTKFSHAYLVKSRNLLPGPGEGEAMISMSSDPHKTPHLCIY